IASKKMMASPPPPTHPLHLFWRGRNAGKCIALRLRVLHTHAQRGRPGGHDDKRPGGLSSCLLICAPGKGVVFLWVRIPPGSFVVLAGSSASGSEVTRGSKP